MWYNKNAPDTTMPMTYQNQKNTKRGIIKLILLIVIFILILSYFNIDLRAIVESPQAQQNINYAKTLALKVWDIALKPLWDNYLSKPVLYFWQNIFIEILWKSFVQGINALQSGHFNSASTTPSVPSF
ncbi:MAG: hypothetical protein HZC03_02675 [Candidatus Lloydbacteria bacterium]|nr:hypothetical protein [Candidatus Lloydbacteria bacterium]